MIQEVGAGYIIKAEDRKDLKERIQEVLDNSEKAKFSVERGRMLIKERLNLNTVTQRMIYIYKSCLS
jgi:glycosyltransferase involved in cell wall biosynthesis